MKQELITNKYDIFKILNTNKVRFLTSSNQMKSLTKIVNEYNLDLDINKLNLFDIKSVVDYLLGYDIMPLICGMDKCNNVCEYKGWPSTRFITGYKKYCNKTCLHKHRAFKQRGENNTCHKITKEQRLDMNRRQSLNVKNKIKNGTFKPNITNSWAGSKVKLIINNNEITYRSSWDAFFNLVNQSLEYEKLILQYEFNDNWFNYITDFVDYKNKKIYEIKPESNIDKPKNLAKFKYTKIWSAENGYEFIIISNDWFKANFNKYKHLLTEQNDGDIILNRLRQFK